MSSTQVNSSTAYEPSSAPLWRSSRCSVGSTKRWSTSKRSAADIRLVTGLKPKKRSLLRSAAGTRVSAEVVAGNDFEVVRLAHASHLNPRTPVLRRVSSARRDGTVHFAQRAFNAPSFAVSHSLYARVSQFFLQNQCIVGAVRWSDGPLILATSWPSFGP